MLQCILRLCYYPLGLRSFVKNRETSSKTTRECTQIDVGGGQGKLGPSLATYSYSLHKPVLNLEVPAGGSIFTGGVQEVV